VPIVGEKGKGGTYGKAIKGTARGEASVSYEGKSTGKKVEENRRRRSGMHG